MSKTFLYRTKAADDRDCCAYIDIADLERLHTCIDGKFNIYGACYSMSLGGRYSDHHNANLAYSEVDTILTEEQYNRLLNPKAGDDYTDIIKTLTSIEAADFYEKIIESEAEYIQEEYGLSYKEIEEIHNNYSLDYQDRAIIGYVYQDSSDLGHDEMENYFAGSGLPDNLMNYFDYEKFGEDLVNESENYLELSSGMVVYLNY